MQIVSAMRIRRRLQRHHRHAVMVLAVIAVACAIAAHHSGAMDTQQHSGMGAVAQMCLGVFTAVGAALVAIGFAVLLLGRRRPTLALGPCSLRQAGPLPVARARHGPDAVAFLCVSRR